MRIGYLELRHHRTCLPQDGLRRLGLVASKFIGIDADRLCHIRRKRCKAPSTFTRASWEAVSSHREKSTMISSIAGMLALLMMLMFSSMRSHSIQTWESHRAHQASAGR
jgi:hypothetical protein